MKELLFYTIGHSNHAFDMFIDLLKNHNIEVLADVRSSPFSQYNPQFNKVNLVGTLPREGIEYMFLGRELGARTDDPACYIDGKVQYSLLAARKESQDAITKLIKAATKKRLVIMCAEKDPLDCHRTILVSQALAELSHDIRHILADGTLETHDDALRRLMEITSISENDLFDEPEKRMKAALAKRESEIAFRHKSNMQHGVLSS